MVVDYDGDCLTIKTLNNPLWKRIKEVAENTRHPSAYDTKTGVWYIKGTKRVAHELKEIGIPFSAAASIFLREKNKPTLFDFSILSKELFPFQQDGVHWLNNPGNKLLADEMGLGKTVQIAALFRYRPDLLPALIIVPASLKINWQREIELLSGVKAQIIYGRAFYEIDELLEKYPVVIVNYDILGIEDQVAKEAEEKRIKKLKADNLPFRRNTVRVHGWCDIFSKLPFNSIICDEVQYISEGKNIRTRAVKQICRERKDAKRIFLSGTPYENKTRQFFTCLNLLAPHVFPNEWKYKMTYCDPRKNGFGWRFDGLSNGRQLHALITPLMLRRLKADVLKQLPPKQKFIVPMELDNKKLGSYHAIESQFDNDLMNKKEPSFSGMKIEAFRAKRDAVVQWLKDYLETSIQKKLVVFTWHHEVMDDFRKVFGDIGVYVTGETAIKDRQIAVDRFQTDKKIQLFFGNIQACCVGLTLTAAEACCFVEFGNSPGQHIQGEDRVHRITQESDSVFAYYLIAPGTIEEDIMEVLTDRNKNQKIVLDGKEDDAFFGKAMEDFKSGILQAYKKRRSII